MSRRVLVTFVGTGRGEPGLLTVRAREALARAQVILTDVAVGSAVLESASQDAERVRVADDGSGVPPRAVAALLRAHAVAGRRVVRLVVGDGEACQDEAVTLEAWGVGFDVVPGVAPEAAAAWLAKRPLHGRRILVTRPQAQASRLTTLLEAYGAEVLALPAIRIEPPEDWGPLDESLRALGSYRWIVFTSVNGVTAFQERLGQTGRDARSLAGCRIAAIGPETAERARRMGIEPDLVPLEYRAEALLDALALRLDPGDRVLLVRAAEAREILPQALEARGNPVTVVPAYRTRLETAGGGRIRALLEAGRLDAVTFTSSSTVRGFLTLLGPDDARRLLRGVILAAIGPITAETATQHGLQITVMPEQYTIPALADAIVGHFEAAPPAMRRG